HAALRTYTRPHLANLRMHGTDIDGIGFGRFRFRAGTQERLGIRLKSVAAARVAEVVGLSVVAELCRRGLWQDAHLADRIDFELGRSGGDCTNLYQVGRLSHKPSMQDNCRRGL